MGKHLQHKLRYGDPTLGWEGDRSLVLVHNQLEDRYEIWKEVGPDKHTLVGKAKSKGPVNPQQMIIELMEHDSQRRSSEEILKAVDDHNERIYAEEERKGVERMVEARDKASFYLERHAGQRRIY